VLASLALVVALTGPSLQGRPLRVGLHDATPFAFRDAHGHPAGFAIEVLLEAAKAEGRDVEFVDGSWSECLDRLDAGEIDLLLPIRRDPGREGRFDLSREEMLLTWGSVFTRRGDPLSELQELHGRRIAVVRQDAFRDVLEQLLDGTAIEAEFVELEEVSQLLESLRNGTVDACFLERFAGLALGGEEVMESVFLLGGHTALHVAAPKGRYADFLDDLDRHVAAWKLDPASVYRKKLDAFTASLRPRRLPEWARLTLLGGAGLVLLLTAFSALLRRRVRERTSELDARNRELGASEARMRLVTDSLPALIATVDASGVFRFCNASAERWFGVRPDEAVGRPFLDVARADDNPELKEALEAAASGLSSSYDVQLTLPGGAPRWVHGVHVPQLNEDGCTDSTHVLLVDVTEARRTEEERRSLEDQLNRSQRLEAVGRLAGGVAHDFRNLLAVITAQADLLEADAGGARGVSGPVRSIRSALDHVKGITQSLLAFARRTDTLAEPVELQALVDQSRRMIELLLPEDVHLSIERATEPLWIEADPHQLRQVLLNLSMNARDAMPHGGRLTVSFAGSDTERARLSFADTGTGIDEATLERIFEPFFTTKDGDRGTGLGLALVQEIVQTHGGEIEVSSRRGGGTSFELTFRRVLAPRAEEGLSTRHAPGQRAAVAIESQQVRHIVAATLSTRGLDITSLVASELAALARSPDPLPFDLVLIDTGSAATVDALKALRAGGHATPTLVLAGPGSPTDDLPTDSNTTLLQRPFPMSRLAEAVDQILGREPVSAS